MIFYNHRKKTGVASFISGCAIFIGMGAIITIFSLTGFSIFSEYPFESIFMLFMMGVFLFSVFRKKGSVYKGNIRIENEMIVIDGHKISLSKINLDVYQKSGTFFRYHIWDASNHFSLYSIFEDDLFHHLKTTSATSTIFKTTTYSSIREKTTIESDKRTLSYNLETGAYKITEATTINKHVVPSVFCYDGKFTLS
jgi:hypothetical protein